MEAKLFFTLIGVALSLGAFLYYYYSILKGDTKPHIYTWLIFAISLATAFIVQVQSGGGYGSYITLVECIGCLIAVALGVKYGEKNITRFDTVCFIGAMLSLILYLNFKLAIVSTILIILVDLLAIIPTYRKSFSKPNEETIVVYIMSAGVYLFAYIGLEEYSFTTYGYILSIVLADILLVTFLLIRRKQLLHKI